jgi:hypothetical protein
MNYLSIELEDMRDNNLSLLSINSDKNNLINALEKLLYDYYINIRILTIFNIIIKIIMIYSIQNLYNFIFIFDIISDFLIFYIFSVNYYTILKKVIEYNETIIFSKILFIIYDLFALWHYNLIYQFIINNIYISITMVIIYKIFIFSKYKKSCSKPHNIIVKLDSCKVAFYNKIKICENYPSSMTCTICLESINNLINIVHILSCDCKEYYHESCLNTWISKNYNCPKCKIDLIKNIKNTDEKCICCAVDYVKKKL